MEHMAWKLQVNNLPDQKNILYKLEKALRVIRRDRRMMNKPGPSVDTKCLQQP